MHEPLLDDDPKHRQPDLALAEKELDGRAKTPLEEGLVETIAYFGSGPYERSS